MIDTEKLVCWQSYIESPRWARFDKALLKLAWELQLSLKMNRETSLLRETINFSLTGSERQIAQAKNAIAEGGRRWNDGDTDAPANRSDA